MDDPHFQMLKEASIVHADILDQTYLLLSFSNGAVIKLRLDQLKEFALGAATGIVYQEMDEA